MPDLTAGSKVKGLDTPPTVADVEDDFFTFNATSYGEDADSGVYAQCGVAFIACTTGRALIHFGGALVNDTPGAFTIMSPTVREGATIGSGAAILSASDTKSVYNFGTSTISVGRTILLSGLTPGDPYNVLLEHKVGSGNGTIGRRNVIVAPTS